MRYRYLTFDCYGTLVDWRTGIEKELREALGDVRLEGRELLKAYVAAEMDEEATYKKYREVLALTAISLSKKLGTEVPEAAARRFAGSVPNWPAFPDTTKFLREMGSQGYKRYILSNVDNDLLEETIRKQGLEIDGYVTAEDVRSYKPNTKHWLEFLRKTGAQKSEVLHIAQSLLHDIAPTNGLGIDSVWVNRYGEPLPPNASPIMIVDSLESLSTLLGDIRQ